jgi:hypothetical protein
MKNAQAIPVLAILLVATLSCKYMKGGDASTAQSSGPVTDFTSESGGVNVKAAIDKKQTASETISPDGGTLSLTAADGTKFTLEVPPKALDTETLITMTTVKSLDGSPLGKSAPLAVQLEPSGLIFNELLTLTIIPAKDIPIKDQVVFGYEGDGKDYHLAAIDPTSKEIRIKLFEFSGAGVASVSDSAWAAHLSIEASAARSRFTQKFAEVTQAERKAVEAGATPKSTKELLKPLLDSFYDQVVLKGIAAAELDCKHAKKALHDLMFHERYLQLLGFADSGTGSPGYREKSNRLKEIGRDCKKAAFQIVGGLDDWQTSTKVCDIMEPFTLTGGGFKNQFSGGLSGTYSYTGPFNTHGSGTYTISLPDGMDKPGTMTGTGEGSAEGAIASGTEKYTLTPLPPCS